MEASNSIGLITSYGDANKNKKRKVKFDKVCKQKSVTKQLSDKDKAEKLYGMKFKGE